MTSREKVAAKIKALLSRTTDRGCTEAEAIEAAIKAAELMAAHGLNMTEAEVLSEGFEMADLKSPDEKLFLIRRLLNIGVGDFTETRIWTDRKEFKFFGLKPDVIFATFLHASLTDFVKRHADEFAQTELERAAREQDIPLSRAEDDFAPQVYRWWESFVFAATKRISERLKEAKQESRIKASTGSELMVLDKRTLITKELASRGIVLRGIGVGTKAKVDNRGKEAGKAAGDGAGFNKPVNGGAQVLQLVKK